MTLHFAVNFAEALLRALAVGVLAMVLHELGHLTAAWALGVRASLGLSRKGMCVRRDAGTAMQNLLISLAGPMVNLLLLAVPDGQFRLANLCLLICNLAPIPNADGDRIARCVALLLKKTETRN